MDPTVPLTLAIAALGIVIVLVGRPIHGLIAYLAILFLYPDYLRVSLGSIDISATRIVATLLLVRCVTDSEVMQRFRWMLLDSLVVISLLIYALTLAFTTDFEVWLENRSGFAMDTLFAYLAVRMVVSDRAALVSVAKAFAIIAIPLALSAVVETFTGKSVYVGLGQYCKWAPTKGLEYQTRFGLNRAMGPNGETILFGIGMAIFFPIIWTLRYERPPWSRWVYWLSAVAIAGVAATVSSGPYLALTIMLGCLVLERSKRLVKPLVIAFVLGCIGIELASNRHFYYVLADFTLDSDSAWYRARLVDVAIDRIPEYWLGGYGLKDPGWGPDINGLKYTDIVNDFVLCAAQTGMFGLVAYVAVLGGAIRGAIRAHRLAPSPWLQSCSWSLVSALVGVMAAFWSVSMFGQMVTVLYVLLGLLGSLPQIARSYANQTTYATSNPHPMQRFYPARPPSRPNVLTPSA